MIKYFDDIINEKLNANIEKDAIALVCKEKKITYATLNEQVDYVASMLLRKRICIEDRVVIYMNKSIKAVIMELAVLKIGATFVPIDVTLPYLRIKSILDKANPVLMIVDDRVNMDVPVEIVKASTLLSGFGVCKEISCFDELRKERNITNVAYIIFTSGSTGTPKGVMITHESIVSFLLTACDVLGYDMKMRTLSLAPIYFDTSIHEIYCTLYAGGLVCLKDKFIFVQEIFETVSQYQITDLIIVSTIFKLMVQGIKERNVFKLDTLKRLIFCGEACSVEPLLQFHKKCNNVQIIQGYGPTETTVGCMFKVIDDFKSTEYGLLPLGKLIRNIEGVLLDEEGNIVKNGQVGILYLSGPHVMKGYCGDEELTNKVFVKKNNLGSAVWYKTNDLMYLNDDGDYCFVGRCDEMIKINGKIVFINEVASRLNKFNEIDEFYIVPYQDEFDITKLAAFLIPNMNKYINISKIKEDLRKEVPEYMLPSIFKVIKKEDVIRTNTDKVDKKKLLELL